jgi:hypothetical protein
MGWCVSRSAATRPRARLVLLPLRSAEPINRGP